jgi:hypothetical protein
MDKLEYEHDFAEKKTSHIPEHANIRGAQAYK